MSLAELSLAERVEVEAVAHSYRRSKAYQPGIRNDATGPNPTGFGSGKIGEHIRDLAAQLEEEERLERRKDALRYGPLKPSGLIIAMREDWPKQTAAVQKLAKRLDIPLGEAWARVIEAGVEALGKRRK